MRGLATGQAPFIFARDRTVNNKQGMELLWQLEKAGPPFLISPSSRLGHVRGAERGPGRPASPSLPFSPLPSSACALIAFLNGWGSSV